MIKFAEMILCQIVLVLLYLPLFLCENSGVKNDDICAKPSCYTFTRRNFSNPLTIQEDSISSTVFCFGGLEHSIKNLWSNPMLHINREMSSPGEDSVFITYYGTSVSGVELRSLQQAYQILQDWYASMRSLKNNEDISLEPFSRTCIKIVTNLHYSATIKIQNLDYWFFVYLAIGVIIFFSAKTLSHNASLHYVTGVSIGIMASLLIFLFILTRFIPSRLKNMVYLLMFFGTSACLWIFRQVHVQFLSKGVMETFIENWQFFTGYFLIMGMISFVVVYRYGPVTDHRSLNLIQWFLQAIGLILVYHSVQMREVSVSMVFILLVIYSFPKSSFTSQTALNIW